MKQWMVLWAAAGLAWLTGCATTTMGDWERRIGTATYFDTVQELGVPEITTTQDDGTIVAEWLRLRGGVQPSTTAPFLQRRYDRYVGPVHMHRTPNSYLRMTFDNEEYLTRVENVSR